MGDEESTSVGVEGESESERLTRNLNELLQELRVTQTGVQILTGFLLTLPFSQRFTTLDGTQKAAYLAILSGSVVATGLLIAPVAFHRILFRHGERPWLVRAANRAALTGLLFVAVSINLADILRQSALLSRRAVEALILMVAVVVVSVLVLTPGQPAAVLGAELLAVGLGLGGACLVPRLRSIHSYEGRLVWTVVPIVGLVLTFLPVTLAGASLLLGSGGGLYWLVPALVVSFLAAVSSAWVLLVEIHR